MWHDGWPMGGGMWFGWLIFLVVVGLCVWMMAGRHGSRSVPTPGATDPETVLKGRYARGEIERDEYQRRLDDLRK